MHKYQNSELEVMQMANFKMFACVKNIQTSIINMTSNLKFNVCFIK